MASCRASSPRSLIAPPGLRLDLIRTQGLRLVPRRYTLGFRLTALPERKQTFTGFAHVEEFPKILQDPD